MTPSEQIPELNFNSPSRYDNEDSNQFNQTPQSENNLRSHQQKVHDKKLIKNYILGQKIGQGTFNQVKIATHILTNEKVAIKIIDKQSIQTQADKRRLELELKILRKVRHPNIAQLYQILQNKNYLFLVTQNASRGQLFDHILNNSKLTEFQACKFLHQLLDAIEYIHSLGVVHRDLKPQNILLDYKFNIKLIDFGLSNIYSKDQLLRTACGSPCYAPPQMLSGLSYNGLKADIWSIGVVLYAMCFGFLPFDHQNTKQLYQSIKEGKYDIPDHASKQLISVLSIILEIDCQKRASINQIRSHPFCKLSPLRLTPGIIIGLSDIPYEQEIQSEILEQTYGDKNLNTKDKESLKKKLRYSVKFNKHNELSATYYLLLNKNLKLKNETLANYYTKKNNLVNRYSIAEKVKLIYDKRIKQKRDQYSKIQSSEKKSKLSQNHQTIYSNSKTPHSKINPKQTINIVQLYDRSEQKENLSKERRLKTTNTKRRKQIRDDHNDQMFKKTRLNFNQIQLKQKKQINTTPQKVNNFRDTSNQKIPSQRPRNKSVGINTHYHPKQKSSNKNLKKSPQKNLTNNTIYDITEKKRRSRSYNNIYTKNHNFKTDRNTQKNNKLQRKENNKNLQKTTYKSPAQSIEKVKFKSLLGQRSRN